MRFITNRIVVIYKGVTVELAETNVSLMLTARNGKKSSWMEEHNVS